MTTTVTLTTHDWPVEVETIDSFGGGRKINVEVVAPQSTRVLNIWDTRSITLTELPLPGAPTHRELAEVAS